MRADEEWIVVENLGARGLIVRVIQADQRIPEKRSELAAGGFKLRRRPRRSNDLGQIGSYLQFRMTVAVNDGRPRTLFTSREDGARHLEFPQVSGKREQACCRWLLRAPSQSTRRRVRRAYRAKPIAGHPIRRGFLRPIPGARVGRPDCPGKGPPADRRSDPGKDSRSRRLQRTMD